MPSDYERGVADMLEKAIEVCRWWFGQIQVLAPAGLTSAVEKAANTLKEHGGTWDQFC